MNEFNPSSSPETDHVEPPVPPHREQGGARYQLLERKYAFGLTAPWLLGCGGLLIVVALYLFGNAQPARPTVNDLAGFDESSNAAPSVTPQNALPSAPAQAVGDDGQIREDVANMVNGVRDYAQANRTAIKQLSDAVKVLSQQVASDQQVVGQYQTQIQSLNARLADLETQRVNGAARPTPAHRSPTAGMHLSSVEDGMAWVLWNGKTWAVKEGDRLGNLTVTGIDAADRQVFTSAGVIR